MPHGGASHSRKPSLNSAHTQPTLSHSRSHEDWADTRRASGLELTLGEPSCDCDGASVDHDLPRGLGTYSQITAAYTSIAFASHDRMRFGSRSQKAQLLSASGPEKLTRIHHSQLGSSIVAVQSPAPRSVRPAITAASTAFLVCGSAIVFFSIRTAIEKPFPPNFHGQLITLFFGIGAEKSRPRPTSPTAERPQGASSSGN